MTSTSMKGIIEAPEWLVKRMEALRDMPKQHLAHVMMQMDASARVYAKEAFRQYQQASRAVRDPSSVGPAKEVADVEEGVR